ncbi:MAG: hypothetical protein U0414_33520 [Polyangiaceae bacterium]
MSRLGLVLGAVLLVSTRAAAADVAPPESCERNAKEGEACNRAGPKHDQPGVCALRTCSTANPEGGSRTNPCKLCVPTDKPAGAAAPSGSDKSGGPAAPSPSGKEGGKNGGCAGCAIGAPGAGLGAGLTASLGLVLALAIQRMRRRAAPSAARRQR